MATEWRTAVYRTRRWQADGAMAEVDRQGRIGNPPAANNEYFIRTGCRQLAGLYPTGGFLLAFKAIHVASSGGFLATTTNSPIRLGGRCLRGMRPWVVAGAIAGAAAFSASPVAAQASAPGGVPAISATTEIQSVPSERSSPVRIEPVEEEYRIGTQDLLEVQVLGSRTCGAKRASTPRA